MRMFILLPLAIGTVAGMIGCQTAPSTGSQTAAATPRVVAAKSAPVPAAGVSAKTLAATATRDGLEVIFFTTDGKRVDAMPDAGGSVSIVNAAKNGQDNYTFDTAGHVTRHLRSVGDNYPQGVWEEVR